VLGRAPTLRRPLVVLTLLAAAVVAVPVVQGAGPPRTTGALRSLDARLAARQHSAVLDLYALDSRLDRARTRLAGLERESASLAAAQATLTAELAVARRGAAIAQQRLAHRVRLLYEQDEVSSFELMLGATTLDEALSRLDGLQSILARDREIVGEVRRTGTQLHAAERSLAARRAALETATASAAATASALDAARSARAGFISKLAERRRLTLRQIASVVARARLVERRSATLAPATAPAAVAEPAIVEVAAAAPTPPATSGTHLTVSASAFSLPGHTASGLPVGWGVVAVDPRLIPLGTRFFVPGYGEAVAADVGTGVLGPMIDLWFPTFAEAAAWGRKTVTIVVH
jgi:peptidoglycan DL-endopeptidase CwlO